MHRNSEKKGISTIIAAVFMIAVIILGLGVLSSGLNMQNKLGQVVTERTGLEAEQIKERIEMRDVRVDSNKFNMTLVNTGMLPVKIVRAWVTNTTAPNGWHTQYDNLNYLINPGGSYIGFGQQAPLSSLVAKTDKSYEIKVVTERGTITTFKILNGADAKLNVRFIASPPTVTSGQQVVITMLVTHNNTLADAVLNVVPGDNLSPTYSGSGSATLKSGYPTPTKDPSILRGSTRSYTYVYEVTGQNNTKITFTGGLKNSQSINATVSVDVRSLKITSTDYSSNSGILTIEYTSFRWTQVNAWNPGWSVKKGEETAFKITLTNNNYTGTLWFSKNSLFLMDRVGTANEYPFYITNETTPGSPDPVITKAFKCPGQSPIPPDDYCLKVPSAQSAPNNKIILYFAGVNPNDNTVAATGATVDRYAGTFIFFGKFCDDGLPKTCTGTQYGQNLPFMGLETIA